jgi:hypothetical protein
MRNLTTQVTPADQSMPQLSNFRQPRTVSVSRAID